MKFKKKELLFGVLLGTGLHLLDSLRKRLPDNVEEQSGYNRLVARTVGWRYSRDIKIR